MMTLQPTNVFQHPHSFSSTQHVPEVIIDMPEADIHLDRFIKPAPKSDGTLQCTCLRDAERKEYAFYESGCSDPSLLAYKKGNDFLISLGRIDEAFATLHKNNDDNYSICVLQGWQRTNREVAVITHSTRDVASGCPSVNVMDLVVPSADLDSEFRRERKQSGILAELRNGLCDDSDFELLESRVPQWNHRNGSFILNFDGRAKLASAKNFQLEQDGKRKLLYGKMEENEFALDYAYPLSAVAAFGACLSTCKW